MGWQQRSESRQDAARRRVESDAQAQQRAPRSQPRPGRRQPAGRVLVQTEFPVKREHAGRKTIRRIARLWVKP